MIIIKAHNKDQTFSSITNIPLFFILSPNKTVLFKINSKYILKVAIKSGNIATHTYNSVSDTSVYRRRFT